MWVKSYEPNIGGWYLCKINGNKLPLMWNKYNKFFSDFAGKTFHFLDIDCWLDDTLAIIEN